MFFSFSTVVNAQNEIVVENSKDGTDQAIWDINYLNYEGRIMGFATDMSVNKGQTVSFKIRSRADAYKVEIYRVGYYQGKGARKLEDATIITPLPFIQPLNKFDLTTGLVECNNWSVNATWSVPNTAVSGVYFAKITITADLDKGATNMILFVVRDDASTSDLYFKTSDATWQAYNGFGEFGTIATSLYFGNKSEGGPATIYPQGRAVKVSYDRPFENRSPDGLKSFFFSAEFAMVRWLERNGYSVSYFTDVDAERNGALIKNHKVFLSVGHDEYWSAKERQNVEAARDAGVHLAFFSGNEIYWKTRWEPSSDGRPNRVLVCYKDGSNGDLCPVKCDPLPNVWTGKWRTGCDLATGDACNPESTTSGQMSYFLDNSVLSVPATVKDYRFWRHTSIANLTPNQVATFPRGILGYEIALEKPQFKYPEGRVKLSDTRVIEDVVHKLSLYRHKSGALVFGAGTIQWAWGLDATHDLAGVPADPRIQQVTVNLLADMGSFPAKIQAGLVRSTPITDILAPTSVINKPETAKMPLGPSITITGSATEKDGVVAGVEISTDGGETWEEVTGLNHWRYTFTPTVAGVYAIRTRAFDDMGNLERSFQTNNSLNLTVGVVENALKVTIPVAKAYTMGVQENTVYPGFNDAEDLKLIVVAMGGRSPYTYRWSTGSKSSSITVSPLITTTYTVTVTDKNGLVQTASRTITAVNVSCGKKNKNISICINGKTVCEKDNKVKKELKKGAMLGTCTPLVITAAKSSVTQARATAMPDKTNELKGLEVKTSPNPTHSSFVMVVRSNDAKGLVTINIKNFDGKIVEVKTTKINQRLEFGLNLPSGIYFAEVIQGNKRVVSKLVKAR